MSETVEPCYCCREGCQPGCNCQPEHRSAPAVRCGKKIGPLRYPHPCVREKGHEGMCDGAPAASDEDVIHAGLLLGIAPSESRAILAAPAVGEGKGEHAYCIWCGQPIIFDGKFWHPEDEKTCTKGPGIFHSPFLPPFAALGQPAPALTAEGVEIVPCCSGRCLYCKDCPNGCGHHVSAPPEPAPTPEKAAGAGAVDELVQELAEEPCLYGDGCPTFGTRHGTCLHCKFRQAIAYDAAQALR